MTASIPSAQEEKTGASVAWAKFQNDFDALSDRQIDGITRELQDRADEAEEWLEAVTLWDTAGRPRKSEAAS